MREERGGVVAVGFDSFLYAVGETVVAVHSLQLRNMIHTEILG